jgi:hypothetical protein
LVRELFKYFVSRKDKDEEVEVYKPVKITPGRLRLAFRRANASDAERLAA